MKKALLVSAIICSCMTARSAVVTFDLSPAGTDNAIGLSPLNEVPPVANSMGSGNETGTGISFDTDTLVLSLSLGYGSAFGFTNLTGPAWGAHIHGPAPTNVPAPVVIDLAGLHVLATNSANGGSIIGSVTLTTNQATDLLAGLHYINIHTVTNQGGEIRGQLIPVNTLPTLVCAASTNLECTGDGTLVSLTAQVSDEEGDALTVIWSANGVALQTNLVAAGVSSNVSSVTFTAIYEVGTNTVTLSVADGPDGPATCDTIVTIVDSTPPIITGTTATPNVLWPPNHKMVAVPISVTSTDLCGSATCRIVGITSSQPVFGKGSGNKGPDWKIEEDLTALLRAERAGKDKSGRTYTLTIQCTDESGNAATNTVTVVVPHDRGHRNQLLDPGSNGNGNGNGNGGNKKPKKPKK
jgi:hypothetical protein